MSGTSSSCVRKKYHSAIVTGQRVPEEFDIQISIVYYFPKEEFIRQSHKLLILGYRGLMKKIYSNRHVLCSLKVRQGGEGSVGKPSA